MPHSMFILFRKSDLSFRLPERSIISLVNFYFHCNFIVRSCSVALVLLVVSQNASYNFKYLSFIYAYHITTVAKEPAFGLS